MKFLSSFSIFSILHVVKSIGSGVNILMWDRTAEDFVPIWEIPIFRELVFKNHNVSLGAERARLQGETLRIGYHTEMNLMTFENNGTKLSGLLGDMWTMLADFLNFTVNYRLYFEVQDYSDDYFTDLFRIEAVEIPEAKFGSQSSESHIGLIGMLRRNEVDIVPRVAFYLNTNDIIDYSTPLWTNSFRVYVRPQFESDDSWIFKTFPLPCWISIIISIGLFSLLGALFDRLNQAMIRFHGNTLQNLLLEHFFYTLGAFCNQGSIAVHVERSRIMAFSRRASAWLIISIFSTTLVASMTHKEMHLPFTGIDSLLVKTDYKLILSTASLAFSKFQDIILPNYTSRKYRRKIKYVSVAEDMYRTGCHGTGKDALFEAEDRHRARATRTCTFIPTEEAYFSTWITTGMVKGFQFKRPIDNGILKLIEVGLLDALKDRWLIPPLSWPPDKYVVVGMKQVYVIFTVLAIGVIVSLIIFIVEYIVFIHRRHHLRRKWDKQLRKQALRLKIPLHNQNLLVNESSPKERNIFLL